MPDKSVFSPQNFGVSILGGLAAAAIAAVVTRGGLGGLLFAHLAPLPLAIVAFGFGIVHGATSAIVATLLLSVLAGPGVGVGYALLVAFPGWLAAYAASGAPRGDRDLIRSNFSSWACLAVGGALAFAIILWLIVGTYWQGSLDEVLNPIRARAFLMLDSMHRNKEIPESLSPTELSGQVARAVPAFFAGYALLIHIANLWMGGFIARASALLTHPWPDIAMDYRLPRAVAGLFLAGVALTFFNGPAGAVGLVLAATMGMLLMLQGLAVVHVFVRGSKSSALVLSILYFMLGFLGWPIVPLAVLGIADAVFNYRDRKTAAAPGQPQKPAESD
ncbi:DUF2232 domain-containing protein [Methylocystis parvus]|uniref:DUF2232 domain-containing protein n=1 Tax=Methylocystis parvus TaxID=134 RepID=A0A6B8M8S3_9HYPH|nr:DUF2232 domain-containing protein [Methylocystis parvus]QGM98968.1 DUF2232 domain-containing protein [Methylocystis parvus]WBK00672.1 YybS family protein [Methylocystis parvus OBBP]